MRRCCVVVVALVGCGRLGFSDIPGSGDSGTGDSALVGGDVPVSGTRTAYLKADTPDTFDQFGYAIALSADGQTLAVGAPDEDSGGNLVDNAGALYVFERAGATWQQTAYLGALNLGVDDFLGVAVAISADGNTIVVGAPYEDSASTAVDVNGIDNSAPDAGAAYVFARGGGWHEEAYLKPSNTETLDGFGGSVAISADGSLVAVSAVYDDGPSNTDADIGAVHTFRRVGTTWSQEQTLRAQVGDAGDNFGWAMAFSNDGTQLAIGAPSEDSSATGTDGDPTDNSLVESGAVYIFSFAASWSQTHYIKSSTHDAGDFFGRSLAYSGDGSTLVVSATGEDVTVANSGAVFVFDATTWAQRTKYKALVPGDDDQLGTSVAVTENGAVVMASAALEDGIDDSATSEGAVYIFNGSGQTMFRAPVAHAGDEVGNSIAMSGDASTVAYAAHFEDSADGSQPDSGCVWVSY